MRLPPFIILVSLLVAGLPARAAPDQQLLSRSLVLVNLYRGKQRLQPVSGAVVQADSFNGYVVVSNSALAAADALTVNRSAEGAELVAQVQFADDTRDIALLKVNGLDVLPLAFAQALPAAGTPVWRAGADPAADALVTLARGALNRAAGESGSFSFSGNDPAAATPAGGQILVNECGELVGFTHAGAHQVLALDGLQALLRRQNVRISISESRCQSGVERAREQAEAATREARQAQADAEAAQAVAHALEARLAASNEQNARLVSQTEAARKLADDALLAAQRARENAQRNREVLERETGALREEAERMMDRYEEDRRTSEARFEALLALQQNSTRTREYVLIGLIVLLAVALTLLVWRIRQQPLPVAPNQQLVEPLLAEPPPRSERADRPPTEVPDPQLKQFVLDGRDEDGIRYLLRISGEQMDQADGVIIGRNPRGSPYVINHADVSRQHARLKVMNDRIFIEDLGSTNGTSVNGQTIDDRGPVSVDSGDQIIIGSVVMNLKVLPG